MPRSINTGGCTTRSQAQQLERVHGAVSGQIVYQCDICTARGQRLIMYDVRIQTLLIMVFIFIQPSKET